MLTLAGKLAIAELLESFTTSPPVGAVPVRVTVPADEEPPVRLVGLRFTESKAAGFTVRLAVLVADW